MRLFMLIALFMASLLQVSGRSSSKNLIYTTLGGSHKYLHMLQYLLDTLDYSSADFDFLIIVEAAMHGHISKVLKHTSHQYKIIYLDLSAADDRPDTDPGVMSSMHKVKIFGYEQIEQYYTILYMDVDMMVTLDIEQLLSLPLKEGTLYAATEYMVTSRPPSQQVDTHQERWFGFHNYTEGQLEELASRKVLPFNAGLLLFRRTDEMAQHLARVWARIKVHKGPFYYEQSFLNYYFNLEGISNTQLLTPYVVEIQHVPRPWTSASFKAKVVHFNGQNINKLMLMSEAYRFILAALPSADTGRAQAVPAERGAMGVMLETLSAFALESLPENQRSKWWAQMGHVGQVPDEVATFHELASGPDVHTICEVGFNAGHSTAVMLTANLQATFYSFDLMALPYSKRSLALFRALYPARFHVVAGSSFDTVPWLHENYPDVQCDLFSVDGDHRYEGALTDMLNAAAMVPVGGKILADDVSARFPGTTRAFQEMHGAGYLTDVVCVSPKGEGEGGDDVVGEKRWCYGTVSKPRTVLRPPNQPSRRRYSLDDLEVQDDVDDV